MARAKSHYIQRKRADYQEFIESESDSESESELDGGRDKCPPKRVE